GVPGELARRGRKRQGGGIARGSARENAQAHKKGRLESSLALKGRGFSPAVNTRKNEGASAPEGIQRRVTSASSSALTPPSPPDDTSGTASADSPGRTRRRPPLPAECGPRPTATAARSRCALPTSPAPRLSSHRGCASVARMPSPYPRHTPRKRQRRAETPDRADIRDLT